MSAGHVDDDSQVGGDAALRAAIDERLEPGGLCRAHVAWMDESEYCEAGFKHFEPEPVESE